MMVLRHAGGGGGGGGSGGFLTGKQVVPVNYEAEVSQRLLEASLRNDLSSAHECLADPFVDVNYAGAVCLKIRKTGVVLREESPIQVRLYYEEFRTDATALFVAVTNGNVALVRKLLVNSFNFSILVRFTGVSTCSFLAQFKFKISYPATLLLLLIIFVLLVVFSIGYLNFMKLFLFYFMP